jgi:CheY-like chemotaxis protein
LNCLVEKRIFEGFIKTCDKTSLITFDGFGNIRKHGLKMSCETFEGDDRIKGENMAYKAVLIDDNKNTVLSLEYSLEWENLGIELAGTAYDGRSGKELIEKTDPDIIISDINMPYLDGFTMVEESGKAEDRIIIVITGYDKFQYASRAIKLAVLIFWFSRLCFLSSLRTARFKLSFNSSSSMGFKI